MKLKKITLDKMSDRERQILYNLTYWWNKKKKRSQMLRNKEKKQGAREGGGRRGVIMIRGCKFQVIR